jgi:5-methylcytosine-specific restriction endonuclease McrA
VIKKIIPYDQRPTCSHAGCTKKGSLRGKYRIDGTPTFKKYCKFHESQQCAENAGMTVTDWKNSFHAYRKHRKTCCENVDGRLGFKCTYEIMYSGQLQVDHIDGDPSNNDPSNLQTLCCNCHAYKTHMYKDYATAGRKALKVAKALKPAKVAKPNLTLIQLLI